MEHNGNCDALMVRAAVVPIDTHRDHLSIFGCGFLALSCAGIRTGVIAWRLGAVYRSEETLFFWILIYGEITAGVLMIVFGWCL